MRPEVAIQIVALSLAMTLVAGCATSDPGERALRRGNTAVASGVDSATSTTESLDSVELKGRYNPCHCPAPDFEVHLRGRWQRVIIVGEDDAIDELDAAARSLDDSSSLGFVSISGRLDETATFEETGVAYDAFYITDARID